MALAQLLNVDITAGDDLHSLAFRYIRDFLACRNGIGDFTPGGPNPGPGYEIVDEHYIADRDSPQNGDWVVLKSHGEAGTYPHYLRISKHYISANSSNIIVTIFLGYENSAAWGLANATGLQDYCLTLSTGVMSIHADLDECHIIIQKSHNASPFNRINYWHTFTRFKPNHLVYDGTALQIAQPLGIVENQVIYLPFWPGWAKAGRKVYSWDAKSIHVLTITKTDEASQTITVDTSYEKDAGSWLAEDLCIVATNMDRGGVFESGNIYSDSISITPARNCFGNPERVGHSGHSGGHIGVCSDSLYSIPLFSDIWSCARGRFALAKETDAPIVLGYNHHDVYDRHGVALKDKESGNVWRCYYCYSDCWLAFKEGI